MENTQSEYKYVTVEYQLDPRQQKALEELLPYFLDYPGTDGSRPFQNWTIENLFQTIMLTGSKFVIADKIQDMQIREGLIEWEDRIKNDFRTMEERKQLGSEKGSVINKLHNHEAKIGKSHDIDREQIER